MDLSSLSTEELNALLTKTEHDVVVYNNEQMARKIALNSLYGALGNEYFMFFERLSAEAVTLSGQGAFKWIAARLNEYFKKITGIDENVVIYGDTDSIYLSFEKMVEKFVPGKNDKQITDFIDNICATKVTDYINKQFAELCDRMNAAENALSMKREAIARGGFWVAKKKYVLEVYDLEGVRYDEPEMKITGLEVVRSDRCQQIRDGLEEALHVMFGGVEQAVRDYAKKFRIDFQKLPVAELAQPTGVRGLGKWSDINGEPRKGTPYHVKAALAYNAFIKRKKLDGYYPLIKDGDKIKMIRLKKPNPAHVPIMAFIDKLPSEFGLENYIDYVGQLKAFDSPLETYMKAVGWNLEEIATIDSLFE